MLYIVATPIGNLKDITLRAIEVLKVSDLIACEDTRHTKILLNHYGINVPTTSFFEHNKITKGQYLLSLLKEGKNISLVSDAGTPGISDPGYNIINLAIANGIPVVAIPGPCALIDALVLSGKPSHKFIFEGFLPNKSIARKKYLKTIKNSRYTLIFYESCHRIGATLTDLLEVFGDREISVARELTKKFEEVIRGKVSVVLKNLPKDKQRGEFVIIV